MRVDGKAVQLADRVEAVAWKAGAGAVDAVPSLSEPGDLHIVVDLTRLGVGHGLRCDCAAGVHGQACSHRTAVVLRRQRERQRKGARR